MNTLKSIFSKDGAWSSKRIFGGLGLLVVFGSYLYAVIQGGELPSCTEFLTASCVSLLGVDAVVGAISKKNNTNSEE